MTAGQLENDCRQALQDLRGALLELYASLGLDPHAPQQASRRFELNKNLTWKVSKLMTAEDALSAIQHIPGSGGVDILLTTFHAAGASESTIEAVRDALRSFDRVVNKHAGDRADLDLILDSMGLSGDGLEVSREHAFRGNSGIWGVQAKVRTTTGVVTPNADPSKVDVVIVGGFSGFRLLRPTVSWRLFRFQGYSDDGAPKPGLAREPLEQVAGLREPYLLTRFCSPNMPEITPVSTENYREYILPRGTVGNTGAFDCFFGDVARGLPRYATPEDANGEFSSTISLPVETLIFDILVHRDIRMQTPEVLVFGRPDGGPDTVTARKHETLLPLSERCVELAGRPPAVSVASIPRYGEMVAWTFARLGFAPMDFRGYRLTVKYPPMNSSVVLRWGLEQAP